MRMAKNGENPRASKSTTSNKKFANSLVAVSSAAVMAVYAAGYTRTRAAAEGFEAEASGRRPAMPMPSARNATGPGAAAIADLAPPARHTENTPAAPQLVASVQPIPTAKASPDQPAGAEQPKPAETAPAPVAQPKTEAVAVAAPAAPAPAPVATPAPAPVAAAPAVSPAAPPWKDGKWDAWGTCRHGDIQATVTIEGGKITNAVVSDCQTRYSCDIIDKLPPQVAQRQSENVDNVGGATQSANAFSYAVFYALAKASAAAKGN